MAVDSAVEPLKGRSITPLLLLSVGSGCAALVYEVIWFQLLGLVVGASAVSLGILLASFMGGMCIGSFAFHRFVATARHPLRVYAVLELGIALCGLLIPVLLPLIREFYTSFTGYGVLNVILRGLICAICLLPPTILMGATLPAIARWVENSPAGIARLGLFYAANIAGAVIGTILAGFWLLRIHDVFVATGFAVAINLLVAAIGTWLARRSEYRVPVAVNTQPLDNDKSNRRIVYIVAGLSGIMALGAQVVWTRLLSLLFGATVYTFSVILCVFLMGLGLGSGIGAWLSRRTDKPILLLGACQLLLVAALVWSGFAIHEILPHIHLYAGSDWLLGSLDDLARCAIASLPATMLWGASFPLAMAASRRPGRDPGAQIGFVYAANTLGAVLGALVISMAVIPLLGSRATQQVLIGVATASGALILFSEATGKRVSAKVRSIWSRLPVSMALAAITAGAIGLASRHAVPLSHPGMIGYGREVARWNEPAQWLHTSEGFNASVAVSEERDTAYLNFHIGGKIVASSWPKDMRLQRMLGHIAGLLHPEPKSVLIIGFGAGVTAGSLSLYPSVERIVIVEIEPEVSAAAHKYFRKQNYAVADDPRVEIHHDDGRHYVSTTQEKFDIISADPLHPWVKGAAALYTTEYFELLKQRLNPGGLVSQWVPLYETTAQAVKSEIATFLEVFPAGSIWNSEAQGSGYDVLLLGHVEPMGVDLRSVERKLQQFPFIADSLREIRIASAFDLLVAFSGRRPDVADWLSDAELNRDRNLRLEHLAGQGVDAYQPDEIFGAMTQNLRFPDDFFVGTSAQISRLTSLFEARASKSQDRTLAAPIDPTP